MTITPQKAKTLMQKAVERQDEKFFKHVVDALLEVHALDTVISWMYDDVLPQVDGESAIWAYKLMLGTENLDALHIEAKTFMVQSLTEKGYQMGVDFSFTSEGTLITNEEVTKKIMNDIPEKQREYFQQKLHKIDVDNPRSLLEKHLGVSFVDNLVRIVGERIPTMDDEELGIYLLTIIIGVEAKTKINLLELLVQELRKLYPQRILSFLYDIKTKNNWDFDVDTTKCGIDLIRAAGGRDEVIPNPDEPGHFLISRKGLTLLAQVYEGENDVYELIGALDAEMARRRK